MNEHFIVVFLVRYIPLSQTKGFPVHDMNYTDVTPPPKKKKTGTIKNKLYSFFSLELQKTSIYQITMYAIPSTRTYIVHMYQIKTGIEWYVFVLILLEIIWRRTPRLYSPIFLDDVINYFLQNVFPALV